MLAPYRRVLAIPGALAFTAAGFLARLPISMIPLGIVLLVVGKTGSYGQAGAVSAAFIIGEAVAAPVLARVTDQLGQGRVVLWASLSFAIGITALVIAVQSVGAGPPSRTCSPSWRDAPIPRSAPASGPAGRT